MSNVVDFTAFVAKFEARNRKKQWEKIRDALEAMHSVLVTTKAPPPIIAVIQAALDAGNWVRLSIQFSIEADSVEVSLEDLDGVRHDFFRLKMAPCTHYPSDVHLNPPDLGKYILGLKLAPDANAEHLTLIMESLVSITKYTDFAHDGRFGSGEDIEEFTFYGGNHRWDYTLYRQAYENYTRTIEAQLKD